MEHRGETAGLGETDKEQTGFTLVVQEIDNINTFSQQEKSKGAFFYWTIHVYNIYCTCV